MKRSVLLILLLGMLSGCSVYDDKIQNDDDNYQNDVVDEYEDKEKETNKYYDCSFIKTYRVVNKLDGYRSATGEFDYIVVDSFQSFVPVVISIPLNEKVNLEEGEYYEFVYTLKGNGNIEDMDDIDMYLQGSVMESEKSLSLNVGLEIKATDKVGLEQINEGICGNG